MPCCVDMCLCAVGCLDPWEYGILRGESEFSLRVCLFGKLVCKLVHCCGESGIGFICL